MVGTLANGRYELERMLGEGARRRVYLGRDTRLGREVAIALVEARGAEAARARRQAEAVGRLDHPNIVPVYDIGEENGQTFTVSQYLAGGTLAGLLAQAHAGGLPAGQGLRIADDICKALDRAHARGLVHGGLSPKRVFLTAAGTAKLGDFMLAEEASRNRDISLAAAAYLSPEEAAGGIPDARSDLFSLGVLICELVCGRRPVSAAEAAELVAGRSDAGVPAALAEVLEALLAPDPAQRPQSADAVRHTLAQVAATLKAADASAPTAPAPPAELTPERALERLRATFVGREAEWATLRAALDDAFAGRERIVLVAGEPGIGKTRLAERLAAEAASREAAVLWGRSYEGEGAPTYWPWLVVIRAHLRGRDVHELVEELGPGAADLARLVPELGDLPPAAPADDSEQARFRLFEAVAMVLRSAARERPLVVILDDLHWADISSLALLEFVAREPLGVGLLLIGTFREEELDSGYPLSALVSRVPRLPHCAALVLRGLPEDAVRDLLSTAVGDELDGPGREFADALQRETEGNPFFIAEMLRDVLDVGAVSLREGRWVSDRGSIEALGIPEGVRDVIGRRLDRLGAECRRALTIAAVIGREFSPTLLSRVAGLDDRRLAAVLHEAVTAHVVDRFARERRCRFAHALIRETLYAELSTTARVRLHREVAGALEAMSTADPGPRLAELAYHFREAALGGELDKAIDYAVRAGDHAASVLAHDEAAGHYEDALESLARRRPRDQARECELRLALGEVQAKAGDTARGRATFEAAATLARGLGSGEMLARAALGLGMGLGGFAYSDLADELLIALLEEALDTLPPTDSALRVRVLARLAVELYYTQAAARREAISAEALAMARRLEDPAAELVAHYTRHWSLWGPDGIEQRLEAATELLELAEHVGDAEMAFRGHHFRLATLLELGDRVAVDEELAACATLAGDLRQPVYLWQSGCLRAMRVLMEGRLEEGERLGLEAQAIGRRGHAAMAAVLFGTQLLFIRWAQQRLEEILEPIRRLAERYPRSSWSPALTMVYAELGRHREAQAQLDALTAEDFAGLRRDGNWLASVSLLCLAASRLGNEAHCTRLDQLIAPYDERMVVGSAGSVYLGPVTLFRGLLAAAVGRLDDAERHFGAVLDAGERMGAPPFATWARLELASLAHARGDEGVLASLAGAREEAEALGFDRLVAQAARATRR